MSVLFHRIRTACLAATLSGSAVAVGMGAAVAVAPSVAMAEAPGSAENTNSRMNAPAANEIDVDERLGEYLDLDLEFTDHNGKTVHLRDYFDGEQPVLLTMNYYRCPVLCNVQLNGLTEGFREMQWAPGDGYRVVTVSIDPREDVELANKKRASHMAAMERGEDADWSFLTGDAANIRFLSAELGIHYAYDKEQDQYAHPPTVVFVTPDGKIARYLYGLIYNPQDLKFAVMEAAEGRVGSTMDKIILSCFHYDPSLGTYAPFAMGIMRLGGGLVLLTVGIALFFFWRRERRPLGARSGTKPNSPVEAEATS